MISNDYYYTAMERITVRIRRRLRTPPAYCTAVLCAFANGQLTRKSFIINAARVAELADALDLGSSVRKDLGVQLPFLAPL